MNARWLLGCALGWMLGASLGRAAGEAGPVSFGKEIAPLLNRRCAACHNEESAKGHYRLDSFAKLVKPGLSDDPTVVPGKAEESSLFHLLLEPDPEDRMPQKADALPEGEIALIKRWIDEGAKFDGGSKERPLVEIARETMLRPAPEHYARPVPVTALAFSPDGEQLAVSGYYEVTIWNIADGRLVRRIGGLPERITSIAWNPQREQLAIAGGSPAQWGTVALVDGRKGYAVQILCDLADSGLSVDFSPDGKQLAAGLSDRTIRFFDAATGRQQRLFRQHADWVQTVAYSPDGKELASASRDRSVRVLDVAKGELVATYTGHETPVLNAAFVPGSASVLSLAAHTREIDEWTVKKPEGKPKTFPFPAEVRQFALSEGDLFATTGADWNIRVLQLSDNAPLFTLRGHHDAIQCLALDPSQPQRLASGSFDGEVIVWDLACGTWVQRFRASP